MRLAERGPVLPILARFHNIHSDDDAVKYFEVFRDVIFDVGGDYYVAVPLLIPEYAENRDELEREAHRLANLCYALEGKGILKRPRRAFGTGFVVRQLRQRGSKFVQCYGTIRPPRYRAGLASPEVRVGGDPTDAGSGLQGVSLQERRLAGNDPAGRHARRPRKRGGKGQPRAAVAAQGGRTGRDTATLSALSGGWYSRRSRRS